MADRLANEGVWCNSALKSGNLNSLELEALLRDCQHISSQDMPTSNAGDTHGYHMGHLSPTTRGFDAENIANVDRVDLNAQGGELHANPASS